MHKKFIKIMQAVAMHLERKRFMSRLHNIVAWSNDPEVTKAALKVYEGIKVAYDFPTEVAMLKQRITEAVTLGYVAAEIGNAVIESIPS